MKKRCIFICTFALVLLFFVAPKAGNWLVTDDPRMSDTILVIAGETDHRPARGLELLGHGYGTHLVLDVPARDRVYLWSVQSLAERWVQSLPQVRQVVVCPIHGVSTKEEAREAGGCLKSLGARSVLLVTSDFHTRRTLETFRQELPYLNFSVAAVYDPSEFGFQWWKQREWAKNTFYEWTRLTWWALIDRWT